MISSPRIPAWLRLLAGCLILFLAGCGGQQPALPTSPPASAPSAALPSTGLAGADGHAPVIESIQTSLTSTSVGAVVQADIHFRDLDGDAYEIAYNVVGSSVAGVVVGPELITATPAEQVAGADQILEWSCQGTSATVSLKAVILDRAGHRSNIAPFILDCG